MTADAVRGAAGSDSAEEGIVRVRADGPLSLPAWRTARGDIALDRPCVMGILNVTPDSFWSGSRRQSLDAALAAAEAMLTAGADILDIGGESTRPGARPVPGDEEIARVAPLVAELARRWPAVPVSVDTVKGEVALASLEAGAWIINDVSGLRLDPALGDVVAGAGAGIVLMHSRGEVGTMASYELAAYGEDPVGDVIAELREALARAGAAGIAEDHIALDPGLGFSKRTQESVALLAGTDRVVELGYPVLIGPSRKRFVGEISGVTAVEERLEGTLAACVAGLMKGARIFRVHDVLEARRALDAAEAVRRAEA